MQKVSLGFDAIMISSAAYTEHDRKYLNQHD